MTRVPIRGSSEHQASEHGPPQMQGLSAFVAKHRVDMAKYAEIRKHLHHDPELSQMETDTSDYIAKHLRKLGGDWEIHEKIGGHGVVGVLRNGSGLTLLLRSDMDALPVEEQTGLPYASTKRKLSYEGVEQPVMHACGHDVHMTCLLGAAETLQATKEHWSGTLEVLFQPSEERLDGALGMVKDGLYSRIPKPDVLLGQHVMPVRAGRIHMRSGPFMAASDSMEITFHGRGAHASQPQDSIDPVLMAAAAVQRLQGIVSREIAPREEAVVTVASIHAGEAENVIADRSMIRVNIRSFNERVRSQILAAVRRIVEAEARASGAQRMPDVEHIRGGPVTVNDNDIWERLSPAFTAHYGDEFDSNADKIMGSEDFGLLASSIDRPALFWHIGGHDPEDWDRKSKAGDLANVPSNHSPFFAPVMNPTLGVGIDAFVLATMVYLGKKDK